MEEAHASSKSRSATLKRRLEIARIVREEKEVRVEGLSQRLGLSAVTIRGDLNYLEAEGLLTRRFGSALAITPARMEAKQGTVDISAAVIRSAVSIAVNLVGDENSILIGHGKLPLQFIASLRPPDEASVTVSSITALTLASRLFECEVGIVGGNLERDRDTISGERAQTFLSQNVCGAFLFEATGLIPPTGSSSKTTFFFESQQQAALVEAALKGARLSIGFVRDIHTSRGTTPFAAALPDVGHAIVLAAQPDEMIERLALEPAPGTPHFHLATEATDREGKSR